MKTVSILLGLLLGASFLGTLHPLGDSLAVLRMPLAVLFGLAVIWTAWPPVLRWPLAGLALAVLVQVPLSRFATETPGPFTVYQKNLWFANSELMALSRDIRRRAPDVVTLQEVSDTSRFMTSLLAPDFPHQAICRFPQNVYLAVVSRHPLLSDPVCSVSRGLAAVQVAAPQGPVWVVSLHLQWPWPFGQGRQLAEMETLLSGMEGPVVIGGDFNMVPWGASMRRLARAAGVTRAGPLRPSFWPVRFVPLPIDHVLAPGGGQVAMLPRLGSDHLGLLARVHLAR